MSTAIPTCPQCRSAHASQRIAAIISGGTQRIGAITADFVLAAGVARTDLARLLAAPRQPGGWYVAIVLCVLLMLSVPVSCLTSMLVVDLLGHSVDAAFGSGELERVFAGVVGFAGIASFGIVAVLARRREGEEQAERAEWQRRMVRWQRSWYCHRCHVVFVAGGSQVVAPEYFESLLANRPATVSTNRRAIVQ